MSSKQSGFTLIEFMIAITISLIVVAALTAMYVSSSRARDELQRANQQIENGRYAMQTLSDDLQLAGFYGEFDIFQAGLTPPADKPNPCATDLTTLDASILVHIQGYDAQTQAADIGAIGCLPLDQTVPGAWKPGTDIIVIRRVSTCANCTAVANSPYFQASLCNQSDELGDPDSSNWYRLDTNLANLDRTQINCTTQAVRRRLMTHIYFVANDNDTSNVGDDIPTLKRAELRGNAFQITPLVEGIENLQLEYGIDDGACDGAGNDGSPDNYKADPDTQPPAACGTPCAAGACRVTNWRNVVSVKLHLLARSTDTSPGHTDTKTYSLGFNADNTANTVGPFNDSFKRHTFQSLVRLTNPAERRK